MFEKLGSFIQKYSKIVIAVWIVLLVCAVPFALKSSDVLSYDIASMSGASSEATDGNAIMKEYFASSGSAAAAVVLPVNDKDEYGKVAGGFYSSDGKSTFQGYLDKVFKGNATATYMDKFSKSDTGYPGVVLVTISLDSSIDAHKATPDIRDAVSNTKTDAKITTASYVTGSGPMAYDTEKSSMEDVSKIDPLSVLLILILIGLFFSALVTAIVPPAVVGVAYVVVLMGLFALGSIMDIFYITSVIVLVSMLGAGCDYSIFMISRYKEERLSGKCKEDAINEAVKWAGESVLTSGLAVVIGFGVMAFCSFSLVQTMGIVLAMGIVVALVASLTFTPALLSVIGDKVFWPRSIDYYETKRSTDSIHQRFSEFGKRYFNKVAKFSIKNAWAVVIVALIVAVPATYSVVTTQSSYDMVSIMSDTESKEGINTLVDNADGGLIMPTYAVLETENNFATVVVSDPTDPTKGGALYWTDDTAVTYMAAITAKIWSNDNVDKSLTLGPTAWESLWGATTGTTNKEHNQNAIALLPDILKNKMTAVFEQQKLWDNTPETEITTGVQTQNLVDYILNYLGGTVGGKMTGNNVAITFGKIMVTVKDQPMSHTSIDTIDFVRSTCHDAVSESEGVLKNSWTTGYVAITYDLSDTVVSEFNLIEIAAILLVYVLLFFVLGSYFTPIRSLITIMASIMITIALTTLIFANLLNTPVLWLIPVVLFVVCLGLGMDYDILITTRIREGKAKGLSNDEAIVAAMEKAGGIITLCGLIMGGTFLTLLISGSPMLQELGFALGFGILIDALLMVTFVVPALMHIMGDWCWKGPKFLERKA